METNELALLDRSIAAHVNWLRGRGVEIKTDPADMTMIEAYSLLQTAAEHSEAKAEKAGKKIKAEQKTKEARVVTAVLSSLQRLCALRGRRTGMERVRADFEQRVEKLAQIPKYAPALRVMHDDRHRIALDPRLIEFDKRAKAVLRGLETFELKNAERAAKLKRLGYAGIAIPQTARAVACSRWLSGRIEQVLNEVDLFRSELDGVVASEAIGHPGPTDSRAWRVLRGECMHAVRDAGATLRLLQQLFDEDGGAPAPRQKKDRLRKRLARARKREAPRG